MDISDARYRPVAPYKRTARPLGLTIRWSECHRGRNRGGSHRSACRERPI